MGARRAIKDERRHGFGHGAVDSLISAPVRLTPRDDSFFVLLTSAATNIVEASNRLNEFMDDIDRRPDLAKELSVLEHAGDKVTKEIVTKLNTSFVTPFDQEDIYALAVSLDDVVDLMDAASDHVVLYGLGELPPAIHQQVECLAEMASLTASAMPNLRKVSGLEPYWSRVKELESHADRVHRRLLALLFSGEYEALEVMKLKEVVDDLEDACNAFERIAKTVEAIAVKES